MVVAMQNRKVEKGVKLGLTNWNGGEELVIIDWFVDYESLIWSYVLRVPDYLPYYIYLY